MGTVVARRLDDECGCGLQRQRLCCAQSYNSVMRQSAVTQLRLQYGCWVCRPRLQIDTERP